LLEKRQDGGDSPGLEDVDSEMLYDDEAQKLRDHGPTQMRRPTQKVAFAPLDRPVKAWSRQAGEVVQHLWI